MTDIQKALHDPSSVYGFPADVVSDDSISFDEKIQILKQWEYDARELQVAEEENMACNADSGSMLNRVRTALHELGEFANEESGSSTKHGGE